MAPTEGSAIISDFITHMRKSGLPMKSWYVGIAADIQQRLHRDHGVPRENHWFIWRRAFSADHARAIEKSFLDLGCSGGPGGGDNTTVYVYAYVISPDTRE